MIDKKSLLALFEEGKTADDIAKEFSDALNAAEKEHKAKIDAKAKENAIAKIKNDYADDLASLLTKFNDDLDLGIKGSDIMDFATGFMSSFNSELMKWMKNHTPGDPGANRRCDCDLDADHRKQRGRSDFNQAVQEYKNAGWDVDKAEYTEHPHGFSSFFKAHKESK